MSFKNRFLHLDKPKIRLWWCRINDVSSCRNHWEIIFFPLTSPKFDLGKVEKGMNSFSTSWPTHNATWVRSKKRCFKVSHGTLNLFWAPRIAQNALSRPAIGRLKVHCHGSLLEHSTEVWSTCHPTSFNGHCSGDWSVCICERHGAGSNRSRFPVVLTGLVYGLWFRFR